MMGERTVHPSGWTAALLRNGETHVLPNDDLKPHADERTCWCRPFLDPDERSPGNVWVHNAMDRREVYEIGKALS